MLLKKILSLKKKNLSLKKKYCFFINYFILFIKKITNIAKFLLYVKFRYIAKFSLCSENFRYSPCFAS